MDEQIPIDERALTSDADGDGTRDVRPDVAYRRLLLVNAIFVGRRGAGDREWVLVDAGVAGTGGSIMRAAEERFGEGARPAAIVLTHGHFDHVGALEKLAGEWDVPIYAHPLEHPYLDGSSAYPPPDPSVGGGLMASLSRFYPRGPIDVRDRLLALPDDGAVPGMTGWRWIHTPGHTTGHVSLWREEDRTLIAGDAFITTKQESAYAVATQEPELHGPPMYFTPDWQSAHRSVERLAALEPEVAVTGHGPPLHGPEFRDALHALARDFTRVAIPEHGRYVSGGRFEGDAEAEPRNWGK